MKKIKIKIDMNKLMMNRAGKAHGAEVSRGTGEHIPKKFKKKNMDKWKKDVKNYID